MLQKKFHKIRTPRNNSRNILKQQNRINKSENMIEMKTDKEMIIIRITLNKFRMQKSMQNKENTKRIKHLEKLPKINNKFLQQATNILNLKKQILILNIVLRLDILISMAWKKFIKVRLK